MIRILESLKTISELSIYDALLRADITSKTYGTKGVILDTRPFDIEKWPELRVISRVGVGLDNIDLEKCKERNVKVFTTPCQELTNAVAEFTLMQMLRLLRVEAKGKSLSGMNVCVIGCGRIGQRVKELCEVFSSRVCAHDIKYEERPYPFQPEKGRMLKWADIVTVHVSGCEQVIGVKELRMMKPGSYLLNMARAGCVDINHVAYALRDGRLAGFASDVDGDMLLRETKGRNVILSSHVAGSTYEARQVMERMAVDNLIEGLKGV